MVGVFCLTELARYFLIPAHLRGSAPIQSLRCKKELSYFSGDSQKCYFLGLAHNPTKISFIMEAAALSIVASSPFTSSCATRAFASVTNNDMKEDHRSENATLEPDVEASRLEPMVYKRRSTRRRVLKETSTAKGNALDDLTLKDSVSMNPGTPSEVQAMGNISQVSNEPKHRKRTNRTGSPSIETPKCTASKAVHGSRKRKLSTKSSAKGTLCTEEILTESALSTDDCSCKIKEESKLEFQNVIDIDTTSERYNADTVIKKMDPWLILVHKKLQPEWSVYNPLTMRRPEVNDKSLKLISWNVNGLRALLKGGDNSYGTIISKLAEQENFDVLCLQETKLQEKNVPAFKDAILPAYENSLWSCSTSKLGYSGTAVISKIKPLSVTYGLGIAKHDNEGRLITLEFDSFFLATCYVPNSGQKLERLAYRVGDWDVSLSEFLKEFFVKRFAFFMSVAVCVVCMNMLCLKKFALF
ncbi:hypothetical protein KP509_25G068700 [Ceratopteris richardii]|uniref:DNA-(apurinic or apyrimidinic site) endonuclease n=1 Tax=Ceratopteris richardii TaxID=49495 RepID=A0A8T2RU75_CERRI|nr:hypothetical protein KP509_25G068700 [Ceratopteris richardii]